MNLLESSITALLSLDDELNQLFFQFNSQHLIHLFNIVNLRQI